MDLVIDNEFELVASLGDQITRRVIRGDGDRLDLLLAAVVDADLAGKGVGQAGVPLVQQVDGGRDDQRGAIDAVDGMERDKGLACAGGQDDAAETMGLLPGSEGRHLIVMGLAPVVQGQVKRTPARYAVADVVGAQPRREHRVVVRLTTPFGLDPLKSRGDGCVSVRVVEDERTALKDKRWRHSRLRKTNAQNVPPLYPWGVDG